MNKHDHPKNNKKPPPEVQQPHVVHHYTLEEINDLLNEHVALHSKLALPVRNGVHFENHRAIIRCKGVGKQTVVYFLFHEELTLNVTLKEVEKLLIRYNSIRVSKDDMVNMEWITDFFKEEGGKLLTIDNKYIYVTDSYYENFFHAYKDYRKTNTYDLNLEYMYRLYILLSKLVPKKG